jgi:AmiR/NasT family two-component response regulator
MQVEASLLAEGRVLEGDTHRSWSPGSPPGIPGSTNMMRVLRVGGPRTAWPRPTASSEPERRPASMPHAWYAGHAPAGVVEWQTRGTQNALPARACGFESRSRHMSETSPVPVAPAAAPSGPTKRVLVAEDEAIIRLDLAEMLTEAGYEVVGQASDGEQAVALAASLKPDIVIMDVKMPVMDGISAAEQIGKERLCPSSCSPRSARPELVERARDAGVMAYIVKPFTASDVTPALDIALPSRWAELKTLEAEVADLGDRLETRKAVDRAKGVLMTKLKITEADAFRWIQKTAMDRRMSMREVADAVVAGMEKA